MWIREEKEIRLKATQVNTLYVLNQPLNLQVMMIKKNTHDIITWHQWLAHLNEKNMHWLASMLTEITGLKGYIKNCETCTLDKAHCQPSYCKFTKATKPFERVHTDLEGSESTLTMSVGWNKYYVLYTDNCTQFHWLNMLRTKNKALESFWKFNSMVKTQFNTEIWRFQTDQSEEFKSNKMKKYLIKKEILWESTVPYAHEQNETAEQGNQIIQEKARMSLIDARLLRTLWAEVLSTAVYLTNRSPTSQLNITPYEALHRKKPDLLKLWIFRCAAYAFNKHAKSCRKMTARAWKGVHLSYRTESNQYRIYHAEKKKVFENWDVKFHEGKTFIEKEDSGEHTDSETDLKKGNQSEIDSLLNTLQREKLGQTTTLKRQFNHNSSVSSEQLQDDDSESESERSVTPITIEDNDSIISDNIDNTQHSLKDTNNESSASKWDTSGSDY